MSLKEIRKKKGLTQEMLAKQTGLTQSSISRFENKVTTMTVTQAKDMADSLGVTVDELIREKKDDTDDEGRV